MDLLWLRRSREDTPASWGHPLPLRAAAARFSGVGGLRLRPAIQHAEGWVRPGGCREALQERKQREGVSEGAGLRQPPVYPLRKKQRLF